MPLLFTLALRNLVSHRSKSLIVGSIMLFGTVLVVVGLALLDAMETAMQRSITESFAGDLQLYDAEASDPLVLLGSTFISVPDVGRIERFEDVRGALESLEDVRAVVPMGFDIGSINAPSRLDRALEDLRRAEKSGPEGEDERPVRERARATVRALVKDLADELRTRMEISSERDRIREQLEAIAPVLGDEFWSRYADQPQESLERLDTQVAPLDEGGRQMLFRFLGTDFELFRNSFDGFQLVKGSFVPPHRRGFLFSDKYYERQAKHRVARALDRIVEVSGEGLSIAEDPGQQSRVRRLARQWRRVTSQLDTSEAQAVEKSLKKKLDSPDADLAELVEAFLKVDDNNLLDRHAFFYDEIAPYLDLYTLKIGDTLTVRTYTRSGFLRAVNVKLFGTFSFKGLESSDLAGIYNMMDLVSYRELFGVMSDEQKEELTELRERVGLSDVSAVDAETMLFGGEGNLIETVSPAEAEIEPIQVAQFAGEGERGLDDRIRPEDLESGLILNAAVVIRPGADPDGVSLEIEKRLKEANLPVQVTDWQSVAGLIGQFVTVIRLVLYVAIGVIFLVALVIINNSMVMATMERVTEIGTLRAIGAHRSLVLAMFLLETLALGVIAGFLGLVVAGGLVVWWGSSGLPAPTPELKFLFGGPKLHPELAAVHLLAGLGATLVVSVVSTAYPALLGASIQPVRAMQTEE